jgi:hypothetical protein
VDADWLAEGWDNDEVEVDNPEEIVDPLSEASGSDADEPEDSDDDPTEVDSPEEVVDPLSETVGRDSDAPELGRLRGEVDGRLTDEVDKDVDWPTKLGADVEGTVIVDEAEDDDESSDGKLVEVLSGPDDGVFVDSTEDDDGPLDGKDVEVLSEPDDEVPVDSTEDDDGPTDGKDVEILSEPYDRVPVGSTVEIAVS